MNDAPMKTAKADGYYIDHIGVRRQVIAGDRIPARAEFTEDVTLDAPTGENVQLDPEGSSSTSPGSSRRSRS